MASLVAFLIGSAISSVMLWNARLLAAFGLTGNYYYAVLLALGLSAAASYLVPNPLPFAVTVFVHGKGGIHDMPPKDSGEVVMELGGKVQRQQIGSNRTVDFKDIAPSHPGEAAPQMDIEIAASNYEPAHYTVVPNSEHVVHALNEPH
jgi:hypothetical protein